MALTLRLTSFQNRAPTQPLEFTFDTRGGTVGREKTNDWWLPYPDKSVSRTHASIECRGDTYYITDKSTNGVFINRQAEPLGNGNSAPLADNDRLSIGNYEIVVSLNGEARNAGVASSSPAWSDVSQAPPNKYSPDGVRLILEDDPFARTGIADGAWDATEPIDEPPSRQQGSAANHLAAHESVFDPLPQKASGSAGGSRAEVQQDAQPSLKASPEQATPELIPEDWKKASAAQAAPDAVSISAREMVDSRLEVPPADSSIHDPGSKGLGKDKDVPEHASDERAARQLQSREEGPSDDLAVRAFLAGLDLSDLGVSAESAPKLLYLAGRLLREAVAGTRSLLMARAALQHEFRVPGTVLRPVDNNPLKFSISLQDTLTKLLDAEAPGHLPPVESVVEAFEDLKAHEIALMAGMRAALKSVLARFDPAELERQSHDSSFLDAVLPDSRKARTWEHYLDHYDKILRQAEDEFQQLFGEEFSRAYEHEMRLLRTARQQMPSGKT